MITFEELTLEGFKSFTQPTTLRLDEAPGLILVTGENGAGKSSVWDALTWCLFGRNARGSRGPKVRGWERDKRTRVTILLTVDDIPMMISRTQDPNTLTLTSDIDTGGDPGYETEQIESTPTQSQLDEILNMSYAQWMSTAMMSQFGQYFFDLSSTEKLRVFSEALNLDAWMKRSETARLETNATKSEVENQTRLIASTEGQIEQIAKQIKDLRQRKKSEKEARAIALQRLEADLDQYQTTYDEHRLAYEKAAAQAEKLEAHLQKAEANEKEQEKEEHRLYRAVGDAGLDSKRAIAESRKRELRIEKFHKQKATCSTCGQKIADKHRARELRKLQDALEVADVARSSSQDSLVRVQREHKREQAKVRELQELSRDLRDDSRKKRKTSQALEQESRAAKQQSDKQELRIEAHKKYKSSLADQLKAAKQEADDLAVRDEEANEQLITKERKLKRTQYWIRGFRDVRLWIIEQALSELEAAANRAAADLGLSGWKIKCEIEKQNSEGKTVSGFHVMISSPESPEDTPYENWSGGETQRLRVAGASALAELIQRRSGQSTNLECWDEPTAYLNREGLDDLVEFFNRRALETQRSVWMIDHRVVESGAFAKKIEIVKDENGSRIA